MSALKPKRAAPSVYEQMLRLPKKPSGKRAGMVQLICVGGPFNGEFLWMTPMRNALTLPFICQGRKGSYKAEVWEAVWTPQFELIN